MQLAVKGRWLAEASNRLHFEVEVRKMRSLRVRSHFAETVQFMKERF